MFLRSQISGSVLHYSVCEPLNSLLIRTVVAASTRFLWAAVLGAWIVLVGSTWVKSGAWVVAVCWSGACSDWRLASSFMDSSLTGCKLLAVLLVHHLHTAATIKLLTKALVLLHVAVQLLWKFAVLASQHGNVSGQLISFAALLLLASD